MVKIYTKKGDDGTTSLWYGGRVPKHHGRTDAYGSLDEACSQLGVARALCGADDEELAADILRLQDDLFVAGAELATAPEAAERLEDGISRTTEAMVAWIEERIDHYMGQVELPPKFVIPGGNQLSAQLDVARTSIRRAERRITALAEEGELAGETVDPPRQPRLRPRLRDGPLRRRRRPGPVRGPRPGLSAREGRRPPSDRSGFAHEVDIEGGHTIVVDEPPDAGGTDTGPSPGRLLAASLAACTAVTMEMYAERKGWELGAVEVDVDAAYDGHVPTAFEVTVRLPAGARRGAARAAARGRRASAPCTGR